MSRARPIQTPYGDMWFDTSLNGERANDAQLELLATVEQVDLDDLLDTVTTQGEVIKRLRLALGQDPIPTDVLERRDAWRAQRQTQPKCRKCERKGDSTKHHFVNKWILRELDSYQQKWADRTKNCIPLCIDCHRKIHSRVEGDKSVVHLLANEERRFAEAALSALSEERPKLLILIARGDESTYETRLIRDWLAGEFRVLDLPDQQPHHLRVVA